MCSTGVTANALKTRGKSRVLACEHFKDLCFGLESWSPTIWKSGWNSWELFKRWVEWGGDGWFIATGAFPFPLACWRRNDCGRLRSMSFIYLMWGFNSSPAALVRSLGSQVRFFLSPNQCLPAPTEMTKADSPWRVSGVLGCFQFTSVKLDLPLKDLIKFLLNSTAKLLLKPTAAGHKRWILIYYNTTKANAGFAMNPWNSGIRKRWKRTVKTCC